MKYYQHRPENLTEEFVAREYEQLTARISEAEQSETPDQWLSLMADWNALKAYVVGEGSRLNYAFSKDMSDTACEEQEYYYRTRVVPIADRNNFALINGLLQSRHREAVAEHYGPQLIRRFETVVQPLSPINLDLRRQDWELSKEYGKLIASGEVEIDGERHTLAKVGAMKSSENPELRRKAFKAYDTWFLEHHRELADIFDQQVKIRHQMGRNLGFEGFIPLGYLGMGRTDYGPEEAAQFRENIRRFAVPLQQKLHQEQARALGVPVLKPWDSAYDPATTLPEGIAPIDQQLDRVERLFNKLSPVLAGHFIRMREKGLIDLENRKGKRAGAFCTAFPDEEKVAIFCNSTGNASDIRTLTHEMGHAFQKWESRPIKALELQWPTADAAEIHSMSMEFLSLRHIDEFFNEEDAEKFRRGCWKRSIALLCYVAIVDEFQHWVYEHPDATPDDRDTAWCQIWDRYNSSIDYSDEDSYKYARWYTQQHIFRSRFYYIDYAIAETGAMQMALIDAEDHPKAMDVYMDLCRIGGTKSVLDIFAAAGLRSPFDPDLMCELTAHAARELNIEVKTDTEVGTSAE